jgi:hypothetical protein
MHPCAEQLSRAIFNNHVNDIKSLQNAYTDLPWFHCEFFDANRNLMFAGSAFDASLHYEQFKITNLFLHRLAEEAYLRSRTLEARYSFQYALATAINAFCRFNPIPTYIDNFYTWPEQKLHLLRDFPELKPLALGLIRSLALNIRLTDFFRNLQKCENSLLKTVASNLTLYLGILKNESIFSEHRFFNFSLVNLARPATDTVRMFSQLQEACNYLLKDPNLNETTLTLEMAKKILLLCSKSYPFSQGQIKTIWKDLSILVLSKFHKNPAGLHALYQVLLDKQSIYTEDHIPLVEAFLVSELPRQYIAHYLQDQEQRSLANALQQGKGIFLHSGVGNGLELLAHFPLPSPQKCYVIDGVLDDEAKKLLHTVLMVNPALSLSYTSVEKFREHALKFFPQVQQTIFIDLVDVDLLKHLPKLMEISSYTFKNLGVVLPDELITQHQNFSNFNHIQSFLGSSQTLTVLILNNMRDRKIIADLIISKNDIKPGPHTEAQNVTYQNFLVKMKGVSTSVPTVNFVGSLDDSDFNLDDLDLEFNHHFQLIEVLDESKSQGPTI